jgi:hypothetical protein
LVQRVEHSQNKALRTDQCYFWYGTTANCTEYFTPAGEMFVDIPAENLCCLESCDPSYRDEYGNACREGPVFTPRPDFASAVCNFTGQAAVDGRQCDVYACPATFTYYVLAGTNVPVKFATADDNYVVLYDVASLVVAPQVRCGVVWCGVVWCGVALGSSLGTGSNGSLRRTLGSSTCRRVAGGGTRAT